MDDGTDLRPPLILLCLISLDGNHGRTGPVWVPCRERKPGGRMTNFNLGRWLLGVGGGCNFGRGRRMGNGNIISWVDVPTIDILPLDGM